jgi:adenosylhomocysteine nucleosidase
MGPGPESAALAARAAVAGGARALLSFGLAGGLAARAIPGTVVLPQAVIEPGHEPLLTDPVWCERISAALAADFAIERGSLASVDHVLVLPEEKAALAADLGAVAADMESVAIAREAAIAGVPFVALRVVADGPADRLPLRVAEFVTADGRARLAPLVSHLAAPRELGRLVILGQRSRRASAGLTAVARLLLRRDLLAAAAEAGPSDSGPRT